MSNVGAEYPVGLTIDYPGRLNRLTTLLRGLTVIPIAIILGCLVGSSEGALGILAVPVALMILFRQKYPRWWFDWNLQLTMFTARVGTYLCLLRDEYPSTDEEQAVHVRIPYPDVENDLNRWLPLIKWLLATPHWIVLWILSLGAVVAIIVAWFAILFTGSYPRALFDFVVGVGRWWLRVTAYAVLLVTDEYPPFSLN